MDSDHFIPVDDKLASQIWRVYGLAQAYDALGGEKPKSVLPGFALAQALIEKELAEMRAQMSGAVYRAAAKAGIDVGRAESLYTTIKDGRPVVEARLADRPDATPESRP